ncbi:hypothetical protein [Dulcicalothrix desertica]|uniref:hypothetical protein n=1 Tax=Dulcicalothrix desertica TaxID=32056 RepID=UPI000F8F6F10|nr:hypothetical protein [Dulcicalothrix desertica]
MFLALYWSAVLIFGAANSVTRKLTEIGANNFVDGKNPISFCNVLFVSNLCALLVLIIVLQDIRRGTIRNVENTSYKGAILLGGVYNAR